MRIGSRKPTQRALAVAAATSLLLAACSLESLPGVAQESEREPTPTTSPGAEVGLGGTTPTPPPPSDLADMVENVLPSVVNVRVEAVRSNVFGGTQRQEGQGSGVVIDPEGIILTNNHVVQCAVDVEVVFTDDRDAMPGEVVGTVPEKDLAVVRVEAEDLSPIEVGTSGRLRLGDGVVALGFPLGLGGPTVTEGIVSGKGRSIAPEGGPPLENLLQTDAAINPGNSGGPLVDLAGRLVGINTAGAQAGQAENIGFAIPIDGALPIVEEILSGSERAWLGVSIASVESSAVAAQIGVDTDVRGAAIREFIRGPAQDSGLKVGDVIVSIEGRAVASADDLSQVLARFDPGDEVEVEVVRGDERETIEVTLGERPSAEELFRDTC